MCQIVIGPADQLFLFAPPTIAAIVLVLGYASLKVIARSGKFSLMRILCYVFAFFTALLYIILWQDQIGKLLHWESAWILLIVLLFAGVAYQFWRSRRKGASISQ